MIKKLTITALGLAGVLSLSAAPISPEQALSRISSNGPAKVASVSKSGLKLAHTAYMENGEAAAYIFTPQTGKGFTILSADDMIVPVIGYSDSDNIDVTNLPPSLVWWMDLIGQQVEYARDHGFKASVKPYAPAGLTPISPLVKTKWNQDEPYNDQTPTVNNIHCPTGCVATSFAQVMNYFQYPAQGEGTLAYVDKMTRRTMTLDRPFLWDEMLDVYTKNNYTKEQAYAVAYLMKACGYSVEMSYNLDASGAVSYKLANAAINNFKYDKGTYYTERQWYSLDEWTKMIYDNIKNIGPVIYDGQSIMGGHSFVCDGYDGDGYFHFNWGWGGMSDGYFILDALNPDAQGIGGSEGGFNYAQGVLFGMQPPKEGQPSTPHLQNMKIFGTLQATYSNGNINFEAVNGGQYTGWGNAAYQPLNLSVGAIFTSLDNDKEEYCQEGYMLLSSGDIVNVVTLGSTSYWPSKNANPVVPVPANLPNGSYKVTVATKDNNVDGAPWQPMLCSDGNVNYVLMSYGNGIVKVNNVNPGKLNIDNVEFTSPVYYGRNVRYSTKLTNNSDQQISLSYYPALYALNQPQFIGDYMVVTVDPNETVEKTSFTKFYAIGNATGIGLTYKLVLIDPATDEIIAEGGNYVLEQAGALKINLLDLSIENAPQQDVTSGTRTFKDAYLLNDASWININFDYEVESGYLDTYVKMIGSKYNFDTNKFESFANDIYSEVPFIGQGDSQNINLGYDVSYLDPGYVYRITAGYVQGGKSSTLGYIDFKLNSTGVEIINGDDLNAVPVYYNLQGVQIQNPKKGELVIRKVGNKIDKIIY